MDLQRPEKTKMFEWAVAEGDEMKNSLLLNKLKALLCIRCPSCFRWIWGWDVRSSFKCPSCKTRLESNWIWASLICIVAVLVTLPLLRQPVDWAAGLIFDEVDYSARRIVLVWFEFFLVALLYPRLLKVRPCRSEDEADPKT